MKVIVTSALMVAMSGFAVAEEERIKLRLNVVMAESAIVTAAGSGGILGMLSPVTRSAAVDAAGAKGASLFQRSEGKYGAIVGAFESAYSEALKERSYEVSSEAEREFRVEISSFALEPAIMFSPNVRPFGLVHTKLIEPDGKVTFKDRDLLNQFDDTVAYPLKRISGDPSLLSEVLASGARASALSAVNTLQRYLEKQAGEVSPSPGATAVQ